MSQICKTNKCKTRARFMGIVLALGVPLALASNQLTSNTDSIENRLLVETPYAAYLNNVEQMYSIGDSVLIGPGKFQPHPIYVGFGKVEGLSIKVSSDFPRELDNSKKYLFQCEKDIDMISCSNAYTLEGKKISSESKSNSFQVSSLLGEGWGKLRSSSPFEPVRGLLKGKQF